MYAWEPDLEFECSLGIHAPFYQELTGLLNILEIKKQFYSHICLCKDRYSNLNRLHPGTLAHVVCFFCAFSFLHDSRYLLILI